MFVSTNVIYVNLSVWIYVDRGYGSIQELGQYTILISVIEGCLQEMPGGIPVTIISMKGDDTLV